MKNNKKKFIAVAIAILVFAISLIVGDKKKTRDEKKEGYLKDMNVFSTLDESYLTQKKKIRGENSTQKIQVVNVDGLIASNEVNEFVIKDLKKALEDPTVVGVILKVNSPGGSVYMSEKISKQIDKLKKANKPVYTVMEELAASGGYYISASTDRIYASNETFTGSIGVIMSSYSLEGLFNKYGVKEQNITSGKMKDAGSTGKDMTDEQKQYFQALVDSAYTRFVKLVADGRNMSEADVKKLADGRVYDGAQAVENGLVDKIGDLDMAIDEMASEYDLSDPYVFTNESSLKSFTSIFSKVTELKKEGSDLAIIKEMMDKKVSKPMYLYGVNND